MEKRQVLDHGYLGLVEHWGSDEGIIEAARMSTNKGFEGWGHNSHHEGCPNYGEALTMKCEACERAPGDEKLLAYLWRNKHVTPFEMAGMTIEVQAPIFVFREWHRHRTQSFNEFSARYVPMLNLHYLPESSRFQSQDFKNRQAGRIAGAPDISLQRVKEWRNMLTALYEQAEFVYQRGLAMGVPKEIARLPIPVARYSRMRASANLRNWLAFLTLRMDPKAQWEIREYANMVGTIIADKFPRTWELFMEGKK
jgi:thymidylate synthase (FAD)